MIELLTSSGVDPKTAKALGEFVEKAVESSVEKAVGRAMKSFGGEARSRPQEAAQSPGSKAIIVLTGIIAIAAVVTVQLGTIYWLSDFIRSEISDVRGEISELRSDVNSEISELRSDMREDIRSLEAKVEAKIDELRAEVNELRAEVGALGERVTRIEVVVEDRLPAAP